MHHGACALYQCVQMGACVHVCSVLAFIQRVQAGVLLV